MFSAKNTLKSRKKLQYNKHGMKNRVYPSFVFIV